MTAEICFITAVYGNYEASTKKFVKQNIPTDFICFTDNKDIRNDAGWIIDTQEYHYTHKSELDNDKYHNSICKNKHTFNIAKYYKQAFYNIPRLKNYKAIIWIDGTIEIIDPGASEYILNNIAKAKIIGWHHELREGILHREVVASDFYRYTSKHWNGQDQPYQDIHKQYHDYILEGYTDDYFKNRGHGTHFGVWCTCFVAFLNNDPEVTNFLFRWYLETLRYTTQDQIGFSFVCFRHNLLPLTLPNGDIHGDAPNTETQFYIKHQHGI